MSILRALCFVWLLSLVSGMPAAQTDRPNIILIIADDYVYSRYGFMGNTTVRTPHLDRMAGESLLYTRGYTMPVCSPSLASLLTGQYPHQHGITGNDLRPSSPQYPGRREDRQPLLEHLLRNPFLLPKALSNAGYLTFQTGKLWNASYQDMGFTHGMTAKADRHGGAGLTIGRKGMNPIYDFIDLSREQKKPFFIWHAPMLPHDPHNPPEEILKKYRGKGPTPHAEKYLAMIEWFDQTCGELDAWLEKQGLKENTFILYLSDNGWDPLHGYEGGRAKPTPYENGIRTPMFVRWPGKIKPHRDDQTLASIVDFVPTILDVAGLDKPGDLPGINLIDREAMARRNTVFVESYTHDIENLNHPERSLTGRVVIDGWMKLILPGPQRASLEGGKKFARASDQIELFDLRQDPTETTNLASDQPAEVTRLRSLQDAFWKVN